MKLWKIVPLEKIGKYKVGDRVYSPHFGEGFITRIDESNTYVYPIKVEWTGAVPPYHQRHDCFTPDGLYTVATPDPEFDIVPLEAIKVSERGVCRREEGAGARMTVGDLLKVCSKDDVVCVYDIATDEYLYDNYDNYDNSHDNVDDNVLRMTVCEIGTGNEFGLVITVDTKKALRKVRKL